MFQLQKSDQARQSKGLLSQTTMTRAAEYLLGQSLNNKTSQTVAQNVSDSQDFELCEMKLLQRVFFCVWETAIFRESTQDVS